MNLALVPNLICAVRILLVAPVAVAILAGRYPLALALFVIAGVSDALDGYLARRYGWITELGQILDPAADKLLMVATYLTLSFAGHVPWWLCLTAVVRDVTIAGGALAYRRVCHTWGVGATGVSKLNTLVSVAYLAGVLAAVAMPGLVAAPLLTVLGAAVFVTTVVSGLDYVVTYARLAAAAAG